MTPNPRLSHTRTREGLSDSPSPGVTPRPPGSRETAARTIQPTGTTAPRLALRWPGEVAAALGVGDDFVKRHGLIAELRAVRLGSQRFVPVAELERWLAENARLPLEDVA